MSEQDLEQVVAARVASRSATHELGQADAALGEAAASLTRALDRAKDAGSHIGLDFTEENAVKLIVESNDLVREAREALRALGREKISAEEGQ